MPAPNFVVIHLPGPKWQHGPPVFVVHPWLIAMNAHARP